MHIQYKTIMESKKLGEGMIAKVDVRKLSAERVNLYNIFWQLMKKMFN